MPWSVVSRPLAGEVSTINRSVGYGKSSKSPTLKFFLEHLDDLIARVEAPSA